MLSLFKLAKLPDKTRLRKISLVIQAMERGIIRGEPPDTRYLREICAAALDRGWLPENLIGLFEALSEVSRSGAGGIVGNADKPDVYARAGEEADRLLRLLNNARHGLLTHLGTEPAEWDFFYAAPAAGEAVPRAAYSFRIYLEDIRSPFNVGAIFRTAEAFGAEKILLSPWSASPEHARAERAAMGCTGILPWERAEIALLEREPNLFALEQGGTPLDSFAFPAEGTVIVGSEELGVSPEALRLADSRLGRVSIPLYGRKASLNVSVAFGILMQAWTSRPGVSAS